jgi:hypothetical protein
MKIGLLAGALLALQLAATPARAADDAIIARLATCQDSWLDWNTADPVAMKDFVDRFRADFSHSGNDPFWTPKKPKSILGLRVLQAFPESVGMGVGFSVTVDATFDETRTSLEKTVGKKLAKCETSDGMRSCELEIAQKRTIMLMSGDDPKASETLVGCYYYYEK